MTRADLIDRMKRAKADRRLAETIIRESVAARPTPLSVERQLTGMIRMVRGYDGVERRESFAAWFFDLSTPDDE